MKAKKSLLVCLATLLALIAIAGASAADTQTVTVPAGSTQTQNLGSMADGDLLTIDWSSTNAVAVSAVINGPAGYTKTYSSSIFGLDVIDISQTGDYSITFTNAGSTASTVQLTWDVSPFSPGHTLSNIVTTIVIILVVIIVVIVVIVILVFVLGSKKKKEAAVAGAPPGIVTPSTPGVCPVCGTQTDTNAQFCAKCGARFR